MFNRVENIFIILVFTLVAQAKHPVPEIKRPPNVILIAVDTLRSDHLGCYGYLRNTSPNIDAFADQGVLFEKCYSPATWTLPAFMSVFTGLMPLVHNCNYSTMPSLLSSIPTLPEQFKSRGYYCAAVVSSPAISGKYGFSRGFDSYDDYSVFLAAGVGDFAGDVQSKHKNINDIVSGAIVTLQAKIMMDRAKKSNKPFFLFIVYFDPHAFYVPPVPYNTMFDPNYSGTICGRDLFKAKFSSAQDRDLQHLAALYDGEIRYTDDQIGDLLKKIDQISAPEDTITIFISDHGEAFLEHGKVEHANNPYREEVCVPMIWRWPGVLPEGHRVKEPVWLVDIVSTFKELMDFDKPDILQGKSLWPLFRGGQTSHKRSIYSQKAYGLHPEHIALTQGNLRCHVLFDKELHQKSRYEFYDITKDPWEQINRIESEPLQFPAMKRSMARMWQQCVDIRTFYEKGGTRAPIDLTEEDRRRLKSLGYIE